MDLDCTYGATYYLILGLMKGLHTYASINKLFNQPMGGVCDLLIECLLRDGATLLDACCLANGNTVWCAAKGLESNVRLSGIRPNIAVSGAVSDGTCKSSTFSMCRLIHRQMCVIPVLWLELDVVQLYSRTGFFSVIQFKCAYSSLKSNACH